MKRIPFDTTQQIQEWIINNVQPQDLVLTSGGRLARQILGLFRMQRIAFGDSAWLPLQVMSLNEWLRRIWADLWPEFFLSCDMRRLFFWLKAMEKVPPPGMAFQGLSVARDLDESYATLVRHLIDPCRRDAYQPLSKWFYEVSRVFDELMGLEGYVHPAGLPLIISKVISKRFKQGYDTDNHIGLNRIYSDASGGIDTRNLLIPRRILLAGLEQSSPAERELFSSLDGAAEVIWLCVQRIKGADSSKIEGFSFSDRVQEVEWIVERAVESSHEFPLHRVGIAIADMKNYEHLFQRFFREILGERGGDGCSYYNITMGRPVSLSPLAQAAILPVIAVLNNQERSVVFSILQSPYYAIWAQHRHKLALLDRSWRKAGIDKGFKALLDSVRGEDTEGAKVVGELFDTLDSALPQDSLATVSGWNQRLQDIWDGFGFPAVSGEEDRIVWEHIREGIGVLNRELGNEAVYLKEYFKWLSDFLTNKVFSIRGYENAGFQIMGLIEARGLSFDRLFITGMVSGALPQPARPLPYLSSDERKMVQGGTAHDQYRFSEEVFKYLTSSAPDIICTRPEQDGEGPLLSSPFFPEDSKKTVALDLWRTQNPVWGRSGWLSQARRGIMVKDDSLYKTLLQSDCEPPLPLPSAIPVIALEDGIICPFRFFTLHCLGLEGLEDIKTGIIPKVRGIMIHRCLARFVEEVMLKGLDLVENWDVLKGLLREKAREILAPLLDSLLWQVELRRWVDEEDDGLGLLSQWISEEKSNWARGYRWVGSELPFYDMEFAGDSIKISGRVDRIDYNPEDGIVCWDYKTGGVPTSKEILGLRSTQILAYSAAVQRGAIKLGIPSCASIDFGYIHLESAGRVRFFHPLKEEDLRRDVMGRWEGKVLQLFERLAKGYVHPSPIDNDTGLCDRCSVGALCGYSFLT